MKIINLGRGQGKTTRLLYASEFNGCPIVCSTFQQKRHLTDMAKNLSLKIPEPFCVEELSNEYSVKSSIIDKDILVDEAHWVLQALLKNMGMKGEIKAITLHTDEEE